MVLPLILYYQLHCTIIHCHILSALLCIVRFVSLASLSVIIVTCDIKHVVNTLCDSSNNLFVCYPHFCVFKAPLFTCVDWMYSKQTFSRGPRAIMSHILLSVTKITQIKNCFWRLKTWTWDPLAQNFCPKPTNPNVLAALTVHCVCMRVCVFRISDICMHLHIVCVLCLILYLNVMQY